MIYLISDIHGDINHKGLKEYINTASDNDILIILGDIGLEFEKTAENKAFTEKFLSINKNIAFLDGNHENFSFLYSFPEVKWNGGIVHRLSDSIVHLTRGSVYTIEEHTLFAFGGCKSSQKWKDAGLWFEGEEASDEELKRAYASIEKHGFKIDYILTHKYEAEPVDDKTDMGLLELCQALEQRVDFKKWYSGHWHCDEKKDDKHFVVYKKLTPLS